MSIRSSIVGPFHQSRPHGSSGGQSKNFTVPFWIHGQMSLLIRDVCCRLRCIPPQPADVHLRSTSSRIVPRGPNPPAVVGENLPAAASVQLRRDAGARRRHCLLHPRKHSLGCLQIFCVTLRQSSVALHCLILLGALTQPALCLR
jgi:hypothetical protein